MKNKVEWKEFPSWRDDILIFPAWTGAFDSGGQLLAQIDKVGQDGLVNVWNFNRSILRAKFDTLDNAKEWVRFNLG